MSALCADTPTTAFTPDLLELQGHIPIAEAAAQPPAVEEQGDPAVEEQDDPAAELKRLRARVADLEKVVGNSNDVQKADVKQKVKKEKSAEASGSGSGTKSKKAPAVIVIDD